MVYSTPLLFPHYSEPIWGYGHQLSSKPVDEGSNDFYGNRRSYGGGAWFNTEGRNYFSGNEGARKGRVFVTSRTNVNSSDNRKLGKERSENGRQKTNALVSEIVHKNERAKTMNNQRVDKNDSSLDSVGGNRPPKNHRQDSFHSPLQNSLRLTQMEPRNGDSRTDKQRLKLIPNKDFEKNPSNNRHNNTRENKDINKHIMGNIAWNTDRGTNRGRQLESIVTPYHGDQQDINNYNLSISSTGRKPFNIQNQRENESGDSDASVGGGRAFKQDGGNNDMGRNVFSDSAWNRNHASKDAKGQRFDSENHRFTAWRETPWIPSEVPKFIKKNSAIQDRNDAKSEVRLYLDTKTGKYVKKANAEDPEGRWEHGDVFPHRDRLSDVWHRGQSGPGVHRMTSSTQVIEDVPIFEDGVNRYRDSKWTGGYNLGAESEGEVDGEPIKNPRTGTRVSTSIPTVVTTYTLPNGTKVVRLRRIVRYRRPDEQGKSFGDVAKNLIQKKLSKLYVDVDNTRGPIRLNVLAMGGNFPRMFRIKITQVKRGSPLEAPRNCLQYYRGAMGTIESFNYQMNADSNLPARPGYMNNLNYAICIKKEPGYCSITYTNDGPFQLTNVDADGQLLIPPGQAGAEVFNCPDDYIVINGIRLCGERLNDASVQLDFNQNSPVTDSGNGPFMIPVRTNDNTNGRGFRINYQQNQCSG
ncbi:hypothetical protein C0J52_06027 [Blattella germanica]|nr:hypothetical protein C0J52_06027 [Blattella germanica]